MQIRPVHRVGVAAGHGSKRHFIQPRQTPPWPTAESQHQPEVYYCTGAAPHAPIPCPRTMLPAAGRPSSILTGGQPRRAQ